MSQSSHTDVTLLKKRSNSGLFYKKTSVWLWCGVRRQTFSKIKPRWVQKAKIWAEGRGEGSEGTRIIPLVIHSPAHITSDTSCCGLRKKTPRWEATFPAILRTNSWNLVTLHCNYCWWDGLFNLKNHLQSFFPSFYLLSSVQLSLGQCVISCWHTKFLKYATICHLIHRKTGKPDLSQRCSSRVDSFSLSCQSMDLMRNLNRNYTHTHWSQISSYESSF